MWAETTRPNYERSGPRYAVDLTDEKWVLIASSLPRPRCLTPPCCGLAPTDFGLKPQPKTYRSVLAAWSEAAVSA